MKRTGYLIGSILLTAIVGYVLYRSVPDWKQAGSVMISGNPLWLLGGLGCVALHMVMRALRWGVLLTPVKRSIRLKNLLSLTLVKYVLNIIPPRVGEIAGSLLLARKESVPASSVIAASVFERILDTVAVMILFTLYLVFFAGWYAPVSERGREIFETVRMSTIVGLVVMIVVLVVLVVVLRSPRWHDRVPKAIQRHVLSFMNGLRAMQSRSAAAKALSLSLLIWICISGQLWCLTRSYVSEFPLMGGVLVMAMTVLGVAIPTPGGVGGFQFFMNLTLIHFFRPYLSSLDPESQAAGISNGVYIVCMGPIILAGLILLHREGLSFSRAASLTETRSSGQI